MRRRPAWLGGPGKDADGAVLLTGPEAGGLLKAAVEHAGDILRCAVHLMSGQLQTQFVQAQGALVEVFTQRLKECPVLGEGT